MADLRCQVITRLYDDMIAAILSLNSRSVDIGFVGDPYPQSCIPFDCEFNAFSVQSLIRQVLDQLMVSPRSLQLVILEPPLFSIQIKHLLAVTVLEHFQVAGLGFFPRTVSCLAGMQRAHGLVLDPHEQLAVPCFDFRELVTKTVGLKDASVEDRVRQKLEIDLRKPVCETVVTMNDRNVWQGASALLSQRRVWPLFTRDKFKRGGKVWDALYDMK